MKKITGYKVDNDGFVIDVVTVVESLNHPDDVIITQPKTSFWKQKWTGSEWIEGATQEEIDEITKVEPQPPTQEELMERRLADLELMLAEILTI